jgi:hypothetical protein
MHKINHYPILKHQYSFKIQHLEESIVLREMVVEAFKYRIQMHYCSITIFLEISLSKEVVGL